MKKIFVYACLSLSLVSISCSDLLTEEPLDRLSATTYYTTLAEITSAVNAAYSPIRSQFGGRYGVMYTAMEDYSSGQGVYIPIASYQGFPSSIISLTDAAWASFYQTIRLSNTVIKYTPNIDATDAQKNAAIGEAKFLRALSYFCLVKNWGGVPIKTEPTETFDQIGGKRATVAEVYQFLLDDLKFAEVNLPSTQAQVGRATKWAAKTMMADVYLFTGDFANARDKADEVIKSGLYSLVSVTKPEDFELLFGPTTVTTTEEIFSFKFSRLNGNTLPQYYAASNSAYANTGFGTFFGFPTYPLLSNWNKNDLRYKFDVYTTYPTKTGAIVSTSPSQPIRFGKFKDAGFAPSHGNDTPLYRYADPLLIYAEAASQINNGPTALALERLNMVHRRAFGFNPTVPAPSVDFTLTGQTAATFRDLVLTERAYEFLCEGKRWFDLIRTGTVKQVIKTAKNITVADAHLIWPIPKQEIDNNPDINPEDQ